MAGGNSAFIDSTHPWSPLPYTDGHQDFLKKGGADHVQHLARPWVCHVEKYNFTLVSVFHFGLMDAEDQVESWYHKSVYT